MRNLKWYHLVAIALGLGAIVAIIYIVLNNDNIRERITIRKSEEIEE